MHVLIVGGGGREHALAWGLARSASVSRLSAWPGNPGMAELGECLGGDVGDLDGLVAASLEGGVELVVIGPEAPLVAGLSDRLRAAGVAVFGPSQGAAQLEGSKVFCKELLRDAGLPTAEFEVFDEPNAADRHLRRVGAPIVVKADGLAAGKGAIVCQSLDQAHQAVDRIMRERCFGEAGRRVVIEECMTGPELSVMALVDGETVVPLPVSQDHKRILDGDRGPNTGGMGAYSPVPQFGQALIDEVVEQFLKPTATALAERGLPYQGVLYGGYMLTPAGIRTLEYNCRFGDPEAQVVVPRIASDLGEALAATATGRLDQATVTVSPSAAVCVVMASGGYPGSYATGHAIDGLAEAGALPDVVVFHAGTRWDGERVVTAGGRVLGVTAMGASIAETVPKAYRAVARIHWPEAQYRRDIAYQAAEQS